jgi:hypothetical protein
MKMALKHNTRIQKGITLFSEKSSSLIIFLNSGGMAKFYLLILTASLFCIVVTVKRITVKQQLKLNLETLKKCETLSKLENGAFPAKFKEIVTNAYGQMTSQLGELADNPQSSTLFSKRSGWILF